MIAVDTLVVSNDMHDIVTKRIQEYTGIYRNIQEYTGIDPSRVCVSVLHTHKGFSFHDEPGIDCYADKEFGDVAYRKIADAAILASRNMQEVTVHFDTVEVPGIAHNRTSILPDGTYRTWVADDTIEVSKLAGENDTYTVMTFMAGGKPVGCISNFALHQDTSWHTGFYSGDFSSIISLKLKEKYGNDFVSFFLLGTCGDINHISHHVEGRPDYICHHRVIGTTLAEKAIELIDNPTPISCSGVKVAKELVAFKKRTPSLQEALADLAVIEERCDEYFREMFIRGYLNYITTNKTAESNMYLQCVKIGEVGIHFVPGEQFVETGLAIKEGSPFEKCFVVQLSNSPRGYVGTTKAFDKEHDMLYETTLSTHSNLVPEAADQFVEKSIELAKTLK